MGSFFAKQAGYIFKLLVKIINKFCYLAILLAAVFGMATSVIGANCSTSAAGIKELFQNLFGTSTQQSSAASVNVYLGGIPLGFTLNCKGVIVIAVGQVHTKDGIIDTIVEGNIAVGDIVTHIDGTQITSASVISETLSSQQQNNHAVTLNIDRKGQQTKATIMPAKDIISGEYKLGLWVRDNSAGVGTLTYIRQDNLRFGALGHSVCDLDTGVLLPLSTGNVYNCNIIGVSPSKKGVAGELKGLFLKNGSIMGTIDKNTEYGVFGTASETLASSAGKLVQVASRSQVKTGKATILCCVDGSTVKEYSIEIVKATRQSKLSSKSMIIRVTDPELIEKTGGIVQGMSGSPIVQNGMLVGAVTHVFVSDPTKGYGIYAEWMIDK